LDCWIDEEMDTPINPFIHQSIYPSH